MTAASVCAAPTSTLILISDVDMACMLICFSANAWNILAATPAWLRMPTPITDTFTTSVSPRKSLKRIESRLIAEHLQSARQLCGCDRKGKVCRAAIFRNILNDHVHVDIFASASGMNMLAATPGLSSILRTIIFASSLA